jgi:hypothetical protein
MRPFFLSFPPPLLCLFFLLLSASRCFLLLLSASRCFPSSSLLLLSASRCFLLLLLSASRCFLWLHKAVLVELGTGSPMLIDCSYLDFGLGRRTLPPAFKVLGSHVAPSLYETFSFFSLFPCCCCFLVLLSFLSPSSSWPCKAVLAELRDHRYFYVPFTGSHCCSHRPRTQQASEQARAS